MLKREVTLIVSDVENKSVEAFPFIRTDFERELFLKLIDSVISSLYRVEGVSIEKLQKEGYPLSMTTFIQKHLLSADKAHPNDVRNDILSVREAVLKLPVLKVTLAFRPSDKLIDFLHTFFSDVFKRETILDIDEDPGISGGIIVETKGLFRDYSLLKVLDQMFNEHGEEIEGMLR